jgi:hypothetical protein
VDAVDLLSHPVLSDLAEALSGRQSAPAVDLRPTLLAHIAALPADVWAQVMTQTGEQQT